MKIIHNLPELKNYLTSVRRHSKATGLVPTMGALHEGHLQLVKKALRENDTVICSIYINPVQFNNKEDLQKYPATLEKDLELLSGLGTHCAFCPDDETMYPQKPMLTTDMGYLDRIMEGKYRPGHFNGVRLVVAKLFNMIRPDTAYFGKKDFQQLAIIRQLVRDLSFDITIRAVETVREPDGLAFSSRNQLLTRQARKDATLLYKALIYAREQLKAGKTPAKVKEEIRGMFENRENIGKLEYFEIVDKATLLAINRIEHPDRVQLCIAGYFIKIRLIDNISLI